MPKDVIITEKKKGFESDWCAFAFVYVDSSQLHSWVTDGALSLATIGRAPHIPRHAGNAFCDVQLMLTSRRITHQIALGACLLLHALSMLTCQTKHTGVGGGRGC